MSINTRIIAWHLPQFHEIEENNLWWGKGFTEWTNLKKAKPLFKGHNQPRIPLNNNYYNLLEKDVMLNQVKLAKDHHIYGFCFYHYWFNSKKLLEKPIENLLKWTEIDMNFCLSWANEPWTRAWDGGDKEILMPQTYGGQPEWENHFNYLLPFFKDNRYIKIDNKPVFVIYRTNNIPNLDEMIGYLNEKCLYHGFAGLYIIETLNSFQNTEASSLSSATVLMEPMYTTTWDAPLLDKVRRRLNDKINFSQLTFYNYSRVWKKILKRKLQKKHIPGAFIDWDNSPRKGNAVIFKGSSLNMFSKYFSELVEKNKDKDFVFINAWNEWAEGTYLEPDEKNGLDYLNAISKTMKKYE